MEFPLAQALISLISILAPYVLEWIKHQPWLPLLDAARPTLNRIVAVIVAVGQAVGVTFAFNGGTLVITGLDLTSIATLGFNVLLAYVIQQLSFRVNVAKA